MEGKNGAQKRTQAQRRAETRSALLASACRLFGEHGYESTSLEAIAEDCDLTIRPIYYHFGNKQGLFLAVNELLEQRALQVLNCPSSSDAWKAFLGLCEEPGFRQIVLKDAPNVAGRQRWSDVEQLPWSAALIRSSGKRYVENIEQHEMRDRLALATLIETTMVVIESGDGASARHEAAQLISTLFPDRTNPGNSRSDSHSQDPALA